MAKHLVRSSDTGPEQSELDRLFPERLDSKQDQQAAQSQCSSCIATLRLLHNLAHFAELRCMISCGFASCLEDLPCFAKGSDGLKLRATFRAASSISTKAADAER